MSTKEKTKKGKRVRRFFRNFFIGLLCLIVLVTAVTAVVNTVVNVSEKNFVSGAVQPVEYEKQLVPELDEKGCYTFTTDRDFKVLQLTDVHIGSGYMSSKKDMMALNAVAAMITAEKPDLVIVTGDIAYPVPFQAGTLNNKFGATVFADLMEKLGVYWCAVYGNHDTEAYSYFNRKKISKLVYENHDKYPHSLFQSGPEDADGYGNYIVKIKNSLGQITQALFMIDSHSYTDGDYFGIQWKYDAIHENQVKWYERAVAELTEENAGIQPNSLAFFHIAPNDMSAAYKEYKAAGFKDTENVKHKYGVIAESNDVICTSQYNFGLVDSFRKHGTKGVFFGHDHLNNISLDYKGVLLTYGYSIDYLAYPGIYKYGVQRGCTVITLKPDGSFDNRLENYYQDKYKSVNAKENVILDHDMKDDYASAGSLFSFQTANQDTDKDKDKE